MKRICSSPQKLAWMGGKQLLKKRLSEPVGKLLILHFAVIKQADLTAEGLMSAVGSAERERAAAPGEVPLGEWEATRIKPEYGPHLTSQALLANSEEAKAALQVQDLRRASLRCSASRKRVCDCGDRHGRVSGGNGGTAQRND